MDVKDRATTVVPDGATQKAVGTTGHEIDPRGVSAEKGRGTMLGDVGATALLKKLGVK